MDRERIFDFWARIVPPRYLRAATLPIGRQLSAEDGFRFEAARMLNMAFGYVFNEKLSGDYAEFGVLRGRTFLEAWLAVQRYELAETRLHAYDSFTGLPEVTGADRGGPFHSGQFAATRQRFDRTTRAIPADRMTVTEGFFADSLPGAAKHRLAVAWVDCDLYESAVPVLEFLSDQLVDGSVLIFDDWFCFHGRPDKGEQKACQEWLARHPDIRLVQYRDFHWGGRAFIVNRDDGLRARPALGQSEHTKSDTGEHPSGAEQPPKNP